jgi:hypothetical protein
MPYWAIGAPHGDLYLNDIHGHGDFSRLNTPPPHLLICRRCANSDILLATLQSWTLDVGVIDHDNGVQVFGFRFEDAPRQ